MLLPSASTTVVSDGDVGVNQFGVGGSGAGGESSLDLNLGASQSLINRLLSEVRASRVHIQTATYTKHTQSTHTHIER